MEILPVWIWPLLVCLLALAARLWLGSKVQGGHGRQGASPLFAVLRGGWRPFASSQTQPSDPLKVIARKTISPQHSLVLLEVWDQEVALCLQAGAPPVVVASRRKMAASQPDGMGGNFAQRLAEVNRAASIAACIEERPCA